MLGGLQVSYEESRLDRNLSRAPNIVTPPAYLISLTPATR